MPHSNITPLTRDRARTLRREMTHAEKVMWDILRDFRPAGARFRRETPIGPYIADFAWLSARLVVEVDGHSHELPAGKQHDQARDRYMEAQGFRVLRFDNDQVIDNPDYVSIEISTAIEAQAGAEARS